MDWGGGAGPAGWPIYHLPTHGLRGPWRPLGWQCPLILATRATNQPALEVAEGRRAKAIPGPAVGWQQGRRMIPARFRFSPCDAHQTGELVRVATCCRRSGRGDDQER